MAFTDYVDLRTAVVEIVGRPEISDAFDRLTKLAESRFNRELRTQKQITEVTLTITGGSATLPADFLETIGVYSSSGAEFNQQTVQDVKELSAVTDGDYTFQYYAKVPTITGSMTDSNWLLQDYPDAYLYGVATEAAIHVQDADRALAYSQVRDRVLSEIRRNDHRSRYSRSRVRVQGPTP